MIKEQLENKGSSKETTPVRDAIKPVQAPKRLAWISKLAPSMRCYLAPHEMMA